MREENVCIWLGKGSQYPKDVPFHPASLFPEYPFGEKCVRGENRVYEGVRETLRLLGLDREKFGAQGWNPFGKLVKKGDVVILKPNLVKEKHLYNDDWEHIITHGSVIRAVLDYVAIALGGEGKVIIADGPQTDSSFKKICRINNLEKIVDFYKENSTIEIGLLDLREEEWVSRDGVIVERKKLAGDPEGYTEVDFGKRSEFFGHPGKGRYYGTDYDTAEINRHHNGKRNEYRLSTTVLSADVVINLPKLKTHKKAGITCSLKNMVGIHGTRNWLPHYIMGGPGEGGDQFPDSNAKHKMENLIVQRLKNLSLRHPKIFLPLFVFLKKGGKLYFGNTKETARSGAWFGNNTLWRTILDLNKSFFYADINGIINDRKKKRYFSLVDGIIAGEGSGPMAPDPVKAGAIIAGANPVSVDCVCAKLMGFDYKKIPSLERAFKIEHYPLADFGYDDIQVISNMEIYNKRLAQILKEDIFHFRPHFGWKGHIEL